MDYHQKSKLITMTGGHRDAAIEYGEIACKLRRGEYVREDIVKAHQKDLGETMQAILDYLKTI